ncbi:Crp/Fnr family transcriptional regulator [Peptoniphilus sp.]|jgi:CRP-like cAMP-binding protein|uniref:Crp/Fnr family transcriptional regulator n=1 Tax=Peptoniphilus sp. TaxID=1971214 RepID=UPI003D94EDDA
MKINLSNTRLFNGISESEIEMLLRCISSYKKFYKKGDFILNESETTDFLGLVLDGMVIIERSDIWGNNTIIGTISAGEVFAETYAMLDDEPLMINVVANKDCEVLFLNVKDILTSCEKACGFHTRLIANLVKIASIKNLNLSRKILHTGPKTIRERLVSYFSECVKKENSLSFKIPYNRQQLADYLSVDRSSMSNELSKMQKDGIIKFHKNEFTIIETDELYY